MKIVGILTIARSDDHVVQTWELKILYLKSLIEVSYNTLLYVVMSIPQFPGLNVVEAAYDMQTAVGCYVKDDQKLFNSFDTWHGKSQINSNVVAFSWYIVYLAIVGTKNVAEELAKISKGRVKDRDWTWFTELADKRTFQVCTVYVWFTM